jgi:hypothetical protein
MKTRKRLNPSVDYTSLTQEQIVTEKGWEFAGEYCRWFDLIHLEMVEDVLPGKMLMIFSRLAQSNTICHFLPAKR